MTPVRLEPATLWSRVKHSTTEPLRFRQQALASENSANITPKQTEKVEASAEIAESSASTKNCPSTSAGVPSQCDDTHSNHDSSDDNQSSDGSQSTQDTCLVPDQRLFMSSKYERRYNCLSDFRICL